MYVWAWVSCPIRTTRDDKLSLNRLHYPILLGKVLKTARSETNNVLNELKGMKGLTVQTLPNLNHHGEFDINRGVDFIFLSFRNGEMYFWDLPVFLRRHL